MSTTRAVNDVVLVFTAVADTQVHYTPNRISVITARSIPKSAREQNK